ncbi:NAD-dependent epimerase/dehydratase family protein [Candidatus Methylopumilus planktonicus]|uniref:polysaccharide biosynthesis C-terminal domain-containing protein n=1 Tax=Candidatus Methylopumilus planktonicus TaxID=1581557 RepID=UPI003D18CC81
MTKIKRILVTGSDGFIGKNLVFRLQERSEFRVLHFVRSDSIEMLKKLVLSADIIVHLAGENRPEDIVSFALVNIELTKALCQILSECGLKIPIIYASTTQVVLESAYGKSKLAGEKLIGDLVHEKNNPAIIYRLPSIFGKWCKPNYNSVVATFCYNISRNLPIKIDNPSLVLKLAYIDDLIDELLDQLELVKPGLHWGEIKNVYSVSLESLANQIILFKNSRFSLVSERVGTDFLRALYSTYISYLPSDSFVYDLPSYHDERGIFVEMLKTKDSGQFSFFTVQKNSIRGSHYHHTKTEKFLIVKGKVCMCFRHLITGETSEIIVSSEKFQVVESIPGWAHNIHNIGNSEAIIILWANEIFNREKPDCISCEV